MRKLNLENKLERKWSWIPRAHFPWLTWFLSSYSHWPILPFPSFFLYLLNVCYMPVSTLSTFHAQSHLIFIAVYRGGNRLAQGHSTSPFWTTPYCSLTFDSLNHMIMYCHGEIWSRSNVSSIQTSHRFPSTYIGILKGTSTSISTLSTTSSPFPLFLPHCWRGPLAPEVNLFLIPLPSTLLFHHVPLSWGLTKLCGKNNFVIFNTRVRTLGHLSQDIEFRNTSNQNWRRDIDDAL